MLNSGPAGQASESLHFPSISWYIFFPWWDVIPKTCGWDRMKLRVNCRPQLGSRCWSLHPAQSLCATLFEEQLMLTDSTTGEGTEKESGPSSTRASSNFYELLRPPSLHRPLWLAGGIGSKKGLVALGAQNTPSSDTCICGVSDKHQLTQNPKLTKNMARIHSESRDGPKHSSPALSNRRGHIYNLKFSSSHIFKIKKKQGKMNFDNILKCINILIQYSPKTIISIKSI